MGDALADVLLGRAEPGGRAAGHHARVRGGRPDPARGPEESASYDEGLLIGYRGYDANGISPLFPFGHGLGYTTWQYESAWSVPQVAAGGDFDLRVIPQHRRADGT